MNKREKRGKRRIKIKDVKKLTLSSIFIVSLFIISFLIGGKFYEKKHLVVNEIAVTVPQENVTPIKQEPQKPPEENIKIDMKDAKEEVDLPVPSSRPKEELIDMDKIYVNDGKKIAYLTFDDGPSPNVTPKILDILNRYNVKATFFIIGSMAHNNSELLKREKNEGHAIGNHTYTHNYNYIYTNTQNFIDDLNKNEVILKEILGDYNSKLIRFPGGSMGANRKVYREAAKNAGYRSIDWNSLNGDAEAANVPVARLISRLKETSGGQEHLVILMHDAPAKETTAQALPQIIEYLKSQGYEFKTLQ